MGTGGNGATGRDAAFETGGEYQGAEPRPQERDMEMPCLCFLSQITERETGSPQPTAAQPAIRARVCPWPE